MVLDILLFRDPVGANLIRESQRRRCKDPRVVDHVIEADKVWRTRQHILESSNKAVNDCSRAVMNKMKAKEGEGDTDALADDIKQAVQEGTLASSSVDALCVKQIRSLSKYISSQVDSFKAAALEAEAARDKLVISVGNVVHESVPVGQDEDESNTTARTFGDCTKKAALNHVDVMAKLGVMDTGKQVSGMSGGRAYVIKGPLVQLQLALSMYSMNFMMARGYLPFYPPFFLEKEVMSEVAQLAQFDDELYKVSGEGNDKYLIATSEQAIAAYCRGRWYHDLPQPIKYAGYSSCFRKEVGSHGRDTLGIFRVHQFDKVEQFVICNPREGQSWAYHEEMIKNAEDFYQGLGLPYRVINICAGALNDAAAKKYDLEAWFPGSGAFRELVSASNCTDYQSRALNCRYGANLRGVAGVNVKEHPHMLNSTLCALTRVMCCICENYQTEEGVVIPEPLRALMGGMEIMKYADAEKWMDPSDVAAIETQKKEQAAKDAKEAYKKSSGKK